MTGEFVNVVNRSKSELTVTFDGRSFVLQPGKNTIDACMAGHARRQHRIMGTEDPSNPLDFDSLVALPGDDDSPAEQSNKIEAMDRRLMPEGQRKVKFVKTSKGGSKRSMVADDIPADANFAADR